MSEPGPENPNHPPAEQHPNQERELSPEQIEKIMEEHGITQKILSEKLGIDKSVVSKDMSGGLKNAGMKKLQSIAEVLGCDFVPLFVPKDHVEELKREIKSLDFFDEVKEPRERPV